MRIVSGGTGNTTKILNDDGTSLDLGRTVIMSVTIERIVPDEFVKAHLELANVELDLVAEDADSGQ